MQHFQPYAADTFACGAPAIGRRNSRLDADPNATTCARCRNTPQWRNAANAWQEKVDADNAAIPVDLSAREIQTDRFGAARALTRNIPDSQYVALVGGKVRMGLSTYEALAKAAAKPDMTGEEYNTVMDALMARVATAPRGMDTTLLATANSIKDKFGRHAPQREAAKADDQSSPADTEVAHHYTPNGFTTTCELAIRNVRAIHRDWADVTCSDCLSYYRPEDDPVARELELEPNRLLPEPRFEHDCTTCIFLGSETVGGAWHDLYFHPGGIGNGHANVLARESSDPGNYRSGMSFVDRDGALALAYIRAQRRGLL